MRTPLSLKIASKSAFSRISSNLIVLREPWNLQASDLHSRLSLSEDVRLFDAVGKFTSKPTDQRFSSTASFVSFRLQQHSTFLWKQWRNEKRDQHWR